MNNVCHSCLRGGYDTFCPSCRKRLFGTMTIGVTLPFPCPVGTQHSALKLSVSGVQTKYSMKVKRNIRLVDNDGDYILKPAVNVRLDFPADLPANEHVTMQIARQVFGIDVADCCLMHFSDGDPVYVTKRFDRINGNSSQCDLTQVTSCDATIENFKYSRSYESLAALLKYTVGVYDIEIIKFFKLLLFNYLIGNGDAHAKNFSLHNNDNRLVLTPAYDLLNTSLHLPDASRLACDLFDGDDMTNSYSALGFECYDDFYDFGIKVGIQPKIVVKLLKDIISHHMYVFDMLDRSFMSSLAIEKYKERVIDRTKALITSYKT